MEYQQKQVYAKEVFNEMRRLFSIRVLTIKTTIKKNTLFKYHTLKVRIIFP